MKHHLYLKHIGLLVYFVCILSLISCSSTSKNNDIVENVNNEVALLNDSMVETTNSEESINDEVIEDEIDDLDDLEPEEILKSIGVDLLNVRAAASLDAKIFGQVKLHEEYEIISEIIVADQLWYQIEFDENKGWIAASFTYDLSNKDPIIVLLYSEMSESSDAIGVVNIQDLDSIEITNIISEDTISEWGMSDNNNVIGYYKVNKEWDVEISYHNSLTIRNDFGEQVIDTSKSEFIIDEGKGLMMIIYKDLHTYINYKDNIIAFEDKMIDKAKILTKDHIGLYMDNRASIGLNYSQVGLINRKFFDFYHYVEEGDHELTVFRLADGKLSSPNTKTVKALDHEEFVDVYNSADLVSDRRNSYTMTLDMLNEYECIDMISITDGFDNRKYYSFEVEGELKYTNKGFDKVPDTTHVTRYYKPPLQIEGDIHLIQSSYYSKDYLEYKKNNENYIMDISNDIHVKYDEIYLLSNNYFLVKNDADYYIYDTRKSLEEPIEKMTYKEKIVDVLLYKNAAVLEFGNEKGITSMNSQISINLANDSIEISSLSDPELKIYKERTLNSEIVSIISISDFLQSNTGDISLGIANDGLTLWVKHDVGYVNKSLHGESYYDVYDDGSIFYYDEVVDEDGNTILSKAKNRYELGTQLKEKGMYIFKSDALYLYNQLNKELTNVGIGAYIISEDQDYLIASDNNKIRLYNLSAAEIILLDEVDYDEDILYFRSKKDHYIVIDNSNSEDIEYFNNSLISIRDDNLVPYKNIDSSEIPVYKAAGQRSEIVQLIELDETVEITFIDTFEKINDEIVLWYRVDYENKTGYIYKPFAGDQPSYSYGNFFYDIILNDGSIIEVDNTGDANNYNVRDDLGKHGYLTSYHSWEGPGFGKFINLNTGEDFRAIGSPILSPDGTKFLSYANEFMYPSSQVGIYSIDEQSIIEMFAHRTGTWTVEDAEWVGNDKVVINLIKGDSGAHQTIIYYMEDDVWQYRIEM